MKTLKIPGFNYYCSDTGRIFNANGRELRQGKNHKGYFTVSLYEGGRRYTTTVHRIVAKTFIPNPYNFVQVNHKDEDKENNNVSNLEWCNNAYNCSYGTRAERSAKGHEKSIVATDKSGNRRVFGSVKAASVSLNIDSSSISKVAKGKRQSAGGYSFNYDI